MPGIGFGFMTLVLLVVVNWFIMDFISKRKTKRKIRNLVFPEGIVGNTKNRTYLSTKVAGIEEPLEFGEV